MRKLAIALIVLGGVMIAVRGIVPAVAERSMNKVLQRPPYPASQGAEELTAKLPLADMHADSLLWGRDLLRRSSRGHVDVPRLIQGHVALQVFSLVSKTPAA